VPPDNGPIWEESWANFEEAEAAREEIEAEASLLFDSKFGEELKEFLALPSGQASYPEVDTRLLTLFHSRMG
jgi:hypothetical protein